MDFSFSEEQDITAELARSIFDKACASDRQRLLELAGSRFDSDLWHTLGTSGLLSFGVPEAFGGDGLGSLEMFTVLVEGGRRVAPVPLYTHAPAAVLLAELGSAEIQADILPRLSGGTVLTVAVAEPHARTQRTPATRAVRDGDAYLLHGEKTLVAAGDIAEVILVTATTEDGPAVFAVRAGSDGLELQEQHLSDGDRQSRLLLDDVRVPAADILGAGAADRLVDLLTVAACAWLAGLTNAALHLTVDYAKQREQFGRAIGSFQAVAHRLADGYIDSTAQDLTLWAAAWRVSKNLPAELEISTAKWWASEAAHRIAHSAIHIHGGVGVDLDGYLHRYFTAAKRFEFYLGGASEHARRIGDVLAAG
ncbi:acyl-CoA dehydrogenase family protein [Nocardioides dongkuii]|uniref:acyl-CoA dehydrogenase family protein n=1 Tax=Nocardioides dongkuii TaxID=2760089 RepID=UPI001878B900|nr:acyl-CoA dehydrogenase family protein [Nocardioides dongkuii]